MTYLARAFLNPASRAVRADLADASSLHRTVMRAFPDGAGPEPRRAHGVLHRIDDDPRRGRFVLFVQSATLPDFGHLPTGYLLDLAEGLGLDAVTEPPPANPAVREVDAERARIVVGESFAFRLRANTTKKIPKVDGVTGARTKNGTRVPLRGDDERLRWLTRHGDKAGFQIADVHVTEVRAWSGRGSRDLAFAGALFEGRLRVTRAEPFRQALAGGIGPGKAFGFGLLSIQRAW